MGFLKMGVYIYSAGFIPMLLNEMRVMFWVSVWVISEDSSFSVIARTRFPKSVKLSFSVEFIASIVVVIFINVPK